MKKIVFMAVATFMISGVAICQQNLVVKLNNNSTDVFALTDVRSIKFGASSMILTENNNTINTWQISDIDKYFFEEISGIEQISSQKSSLKIYPNPASEIVNIEFSMTSPQHIQIEIINNLGKVVQTVYNGKTEGKQTFQWNSHAVKGHYFCRIISENKTITKPIMIN